MQLNIKFSHKINLKITEETTLRANIFQFRIQLSSDFASISIGKYILYRVHGKRAIVWIQNTQFQCRMSMVLGSGNGS